MNSNFTNNEATYFHYVYNRPTYHRGGSALYGQRNINISGCTFSFYTESIVSGRYYSHGQQRLYITYSVFYHNDKAICSYNNDVIVKNSNFYSNMARSGNGGAVYSAKSVTAINCTFINSTAISGGGGAVFSGENIDALNSTFISSSAGGGGTLYGQHSISVINCNISNSTAGINGGAVYSMQSVTAVNSTFSNSTASMGNGGAIYSGNDVMTINCTISKCSALSGKGGAVYSTGSIEVLIFSRSLFSNNSASGCGVLYVNGHYDHRMEFTNSTFVFNEAMPSDQSFTGLSSRACRAPFHKCWGSGWSVTLKVS